MLSYEKLKRKPKVFKTFTGLTKEQGDTLHVKIEQQYLKQERKRLGRKNRRRAIGDPPGESLCGNRERGAD